MHYRTHQIGARLETLEAREVPAVTAVLSSGTLTITGDSASDDVHVYRADTRLVVEDNNPGGFYLTDPTFRFDLSRVTRIRFVGNAGNDRFVNDAYRPVYAEGGSGHDYLEGGNAADTFYGGTGNDTLVGYGGDDRLYGEGDADYLNGMAGQDRFDGGTGDDRYRDDFNLNTPVVNGSSMADVRQGASNTCVVNAAMASLARSGVSWAGKISYVGNSQFDVRLYRNGSPYQERVYFDGSWTDADSNPLTTGGYTHGDFWTILGQRAFLESCGVDWGRPADSWDDATTVWQQAETAIERLSGWDATWTNIGSASASAMAAALGRNDFVIAITRDTVSNASLVGWHTYTVTSVYRSAAGNWFVRLRNPWGTGGPANDGYLTLSWATFTAQFKGYAIG